MNDKDGMDERVFYHLEMNEDCTDIAIRVTSDAPFTQDEFAAAILCFIADLKEAKDHGVDQDWLFNMTGHYN